METSPVAGSKSALHSLGPGKVVWAKVEGHDWWPARVVRYPCIRISRGGWRAYVSVCTSMRECIRMSLLSGACMQLQALKEPLLL